MSRSRILASLSSSRQMMMAWKVSGLSHRARDHRLAAGLDPLGNGDFALARQELDRAHLAQVHAHGIVGALGRLGTAGGDRRRPGGLDELAAFGLLLVGAFGGFLLGFFRVLALDDIDAHLAEHRVHVLDLIG